MTFEQFYRILKAHRRLAWIVFGLILTLAVLHGKLWPKSYRATATVVVDFKVDPLTGAASNGIMQPDAVLATQTSIIQSDHVARKVVRDLNLMRSEETQAKWKKETQGKGSFEDWLGKTLLKGLIVKPSKDSTVLEIEYESIEPTFAAVLANAFAKSYLDTLVQLRTDPARQYAGFFEERATAARKQLEEAQSALAQAQKQQGVVLTDERLDMETVRLNELGSQLSGIRALRVESTSRRDVAESGPERTVEVATNGVVMQHKADLARLQASLAELQINLGDKHPQVIQMRASIAQHEARLRSEITKVAGVVKSNDTVLREREAAARAAYEDQRSKLLEMKEKRNQLVLLEQEVSNAQRIYESISLRQSQSSLEGSNNQSNSYLLSPAVEPPDHSFPKMGLNIVLALSLGVIITLFLTLAAELLDRRVRTTTDIIQVLELPVIGVLPPPGPRKLSMARRMLNTLKLGRQVVPSR
ncbi:chain length determinant protein EpsF [Aquabacterium lacunae]|uniref:Chain length determinant protein EpsF n=1 Tax=Aquabacterium lacunae TaxID=2528630 RepID=A0A4Q9GXR9_9BURK|nr:chain length determinant protein EpsF [Aquabacterium lacunae]TBO30196.1 chain length determinant protein EpsF [Aquabacterium lacunae]